MGKTENLVGIAVLGLAAAYVLPKIIGNKTDEAAKTDRVEIRTNERTERVEYRWDTAKEIINSIFDGGTPKQPEVSPSNVVPVSPTKSPSGTVADNIWRVNDAAKVSFSTKSKPTNSSSNPYIVIGPTPSPYAKSTISVVSNTPTQTTTKNKPIANVISKVKSAWQTTPAAKILSIFKKK